MKASQPEEWKPIEAVTRVETHDDANPRFKRDSHRWKRDANNTVVYKGIKVIVESDGWRWAKYGRKPTENTVRHYYKCKHPGCLARRVITHGIDADTEATVMTNGEHCHPKPPQEVPGAAKKKIPKKIQKLLEAFDGLEDPSSLITPERSTMKVEPQTEMEARPVFGFEDMASPVVSPRDSSSLDRKMAELSKDGLRVPSPGSIKLGFDCESFLADSPGFSPALAPGAGESVCSIEEMALELDNMPLSELMVLPTMSPAASPFKFGQF